MPRLHNTRTGATVSCSEETAARLGSEWKPVEVPAAKPEPKPASRSHKSEK